MKKSIGGSNEAETSHFLGIDFGKSKIGLAIADNETRMAFAFDTLKNDKDFLKNLKEIVECENVKIIIIGTAKHENDAKSAEEKIKFAKMIEENVEVAIAYQDEIFTTKIAQENIKKRGGRNIAELDDQEAARIILQSWLDRQA